MNQTWKQWMARSVAMFAVLLAIVMPAPNADDHGNGGTLPPPHGGALTI